MSSPLCFVIMPFAKKKYRPRNAADDAWVQIDFNEVYKEVIKPAIEAAGMEPIRADEEKTRGIIHKPMFERIILSDYVVADLTGANANVFYELGIRHAVKPFTTISIYADDSDLPFDLGPVRTAPYHYSEQNGVADKATIRQCITEGLLAAKTEKTTDSPIYQLVDGIQFQNSLSHEKTDIFRSKVEYDAGLKKALKNARNTAGDKKDQLAAVNAVVQNQLQPLENQETGVLIDAMLSYRDISAFEAMEAFIEQLPRHVRQTVMVQEQYGFALNRNKKRADAIEVLEKVIAENGASSETYGILGRVYKDYVEEYYGQKNTDMALAYIDDALDAYKKGFEADWRDAYPGINYATCLEWKGDRETLQKIIPVVEYSVLRKKEQKKADYWDEATLLELAVIERDYAKAKQFLLAAKKHNPVDWMLQSTQKNLKMIQDFRALRGEESDGLEALLPLLGV